LHRNFLRLLVMEKSWYTKCQLSTLVKDFPEKKPRNGSNNDHFSVVEDRYFCILYANA